VALRFGLYGNNVTASSYAGLHTVYVGAVTLLVVFRDVKLVFLDDLLCPSVPVASLSAVVVAYFLVLARSEYHTLQHTRPAYSESCPLRFCLLWRGEGCGWSVRRRRIAQRSHQLLIQKVF